MEENMTSVHGHEVMQMIAESGRSFTRAELVQAIKERFGAGVRFHTCAAEGLTPEALIDFLESRGKFTISPAGMAIDAGDICQ